MNNVIENKVLIIKILQEIFIKNSSTHWLTLFRERGIPCGPINNIQEVFSDSYS